MDDTISTALATAVTDLDRIIDLVMEASSIAQDVHRLSLRHYGMDRAVSQLQAALDDAEHRAFIAHCEARRYL